MGYVQFSDAGETSASYFISSQIVIEDHNTNAWTVVCAIVAILLLDENGRRRLQIEHGHRTFQIHATAYYRDQKPRSDRWNSGSDDDGDLGSAYIVDQCEERRIVSPTVEDVRVLRNRPNLI